MNSSAFGIFVVLSFAYWTPIQGQTFALSNVFFEDGQKLTARPHEGVVVSLIRHNDRFNCYEIKATVTIRMPGDNHNSSETFRKAVFGINDIYTIFDRVIVLRTTTKSYFQMELSSGPELQELFNLTTGTKLREKIYSYKVSAVYEFGKGRILNEEDLSISGCSDAISPLPVRYMIHSGELSPTSALNPFLFWTAPGFNYRVHDDDSVIFTFTKPGERALHYYLVKFVNPSELVAWREESGKYHSNVIPEADRHVVEYFQREYDRNA